MFNRRSAIDGYFPTLLQSECSSRGEDACNNCNIESKNYVIIV